MVRCLKASDEGWDVFGLGGGAETVGALQVRRGCDLSTRLTKQLFFHRIKQSKLPLYQLRSVRSRSDSSNNISLTCICPEVTTFLKKKYRAKKIKTFLKWPLQPVGKR